MKTRRYGLVGYPISGSLSPAIFGKFYPQWRYDLIEEADFGVAWKRFLRDYDGVNVTSPFKMLAAEAADVRSDVVERIGAANVCVRKDGIVHAYNSDYLAVRRLLEGRGGTVAVLGTGGAGRAALAAARDLGLDASAFHHDSLKGVDADIVISTLPKPCPHTDTVRGSLFIEANYHQPLFSSRPDYIGGLEWLRLQAVEGYPFFFSE